MAKRYKHALEMDPGLGSDQLANRSSVCIMESLNMVKWRSTKPK